MKKVILSIEGMTCSACSSGLEKYLNKQEHILDASVNLVMATASISYEESLTLEDLNRFIKEAGFKSLGVYDDKKEYKENKKSGVSFSAHKFIERDYHDGFYYITNHTVEQKNGLGKIGFLETNYDGLIRAEGYFFDSDGKNVCSEKYNTIMIKCDENFSKELFPEFKNSINIETISPNSIVEKSKDFIEKEIESYYEQFGKEKPSK